MATHRKVLVTAGRFHPVTALVRAFKKAGAVVHAVDNYSMSPALHSHAIEAMHVVPSPAREPIAFTRAVARLVRDEAIDLVVPSFEEGFYLTRYADLVPVPLFAPPFATILQLHNKFRFTQLCSALGLRTPTTLSATNREELRTAITQFEEFVARPAFTRGGQVYLTNHGPRAGETSIDDCEPTTDNPWLVQQYMDGRDACSFSIVREGNIVVHCVYEPTIPSPGGWAVQFASIADFGTYQAASTIARELNYQGFLSFDYRRTEDGFVMIECNPRCSAGVFLTPEAWVGPAVLDDPGELRMVPSGERRQYDAYLLDPHIIRLSPGKLIHELLTTPDALMKVADILPAFYFLISRHHWSTVAKREHKTVSHAFLDDITWDGSPMPDPT